MTREYNVDDKKITSAKANVQQTLELLGIDVHGDANFQGTADRWTKFLLDYLQPYDPKKDLEVTFPLQRKPMSVYDRAMVVQTGIPYRAVCAHHLLPVLGIAHVGYIPSDHVVGLSKLTRLVYGISHSSPSLQEDVCDSITHALMEHLGAQGAICVVSAEHGCMAARGVEEASGLVQTVTSSIAGVFANDNKARQEFYKLVELRR